MSNNILVVAAHSDDEVLGCGGTIAKLANQGHKISVLFMTDGVSSRSETTKKSMIKKRKFNSERAADILGISKLTQLNFPDNRMDTIPLLQVTQAIEDEIVSFKPQTVFTHFLHDLNIDHSTVARATLTATRPSSKSTIKQVLGFEVNSSTEWSFGSPNFTPNYFVNIYRTFHKKTAAMRAYKDEVRTPPHPRSIEGIEALASLRGNASGFQYAEAFQIYRFIEE